MDEMGEMGEMRNRTGHYHTQQLNLNPVVDRSFFSLKPRIHKDLPQYSTFTCMVSSLRGELHNFCGTWLRCNSLEWNGPLRVVAPCPAPQNGTFHPAQPPDLG